MTAPPNCRILHIPFWHDCIGTGELDRTGWVLSLWIKTSVWLRWLKEYDKSHFKNLQWTSKKQPTLNFSTCVTMTQTETSILHCKFCSFRCFLEIKSILKMCRTQLITILYHHRSKPGGEDLTSVFLIAHFVYSHFMSYMPTDKGGGKWWREGARLVSLVRHLQKDIFKYL